MTTDTQKLAELAYSAVDGIETVERNDRERLGYHVYLFLTGALPSVEAAVAEARSRTVMDNTSVSRIITGRLKESGLFSS